MDVRLIALLFLFVSCMPTATVSRGKLTDENSSTTSGAGGGKEETTVAEIGWNYLGTNSLTISIDATNLNTAFLTGTAIQTYLSVASNFTDANYCVAASYDIGGVIYELRSRAVPVSYYDFTKKKTMRVFRVDFPDVTNSANTCGGTLFVQNADGNYSADSTGALSPVFDPEDLCPSCTASLSSARVRVFKRETSLRQIPSNSLRFDSLSLAVDPNNNSTNNPGTCSTSACVARGFDCCVDNQCVLDGNPRPSARSLYPDLYSSAQEERLQNPLSYLNYPQIYFICGTAPSTSSGSNGGTGPGYDEAFEQLKKDYACVQNIKSQADLSPFNKELLTRTDWDASPDCLTGSGQEDEPTFYRNVISRLYSTCGCNSALTLDEKISTCPQYDYQITTGTAQDPQQIDCYTPPSENDSQIPTQMTVTVSGRAAPHRFFDAIGDERTLPAAASVTQEGDKFEYTDSELVFPVQSNFSMNAILGQMSVALDKAQPAKTVDVALDEVYFISTNLGSYTPCPSCDRDKWFDPFTAFPATSTGTGLQASGFTTSRDEFSNNLTGGNYEDTIFGRACWIPPTMIPYTHLPMTPASEQRKARLSAQAALFVNGYQRDWYGFNKGALIGSFDGVSWFAVGKGRIVRSTTKKLYLAINAPFADVANNNSLSVNIQAFDGTTQAPQVDYDPQYHQNHSLQNEAGNCQAHHMCSTDTDCITRLGWEYACANVEDTKTNWPEFGTDGKEKALSNISPRPAIVDILAQKTYPSSSTKRCVYRGAGSLCVRNASTVTDLNKKKVLTCAPNFYCASFSSGAVFNGKVARFASLLDNIPTARNHLIGRDANVLGRPLNYLSGTDSVSIPGTVVSALTSNLALTLPGLESLASTTNSGLCLPGKALPTSLADQATMANPFNQHLSADPSKRTDYISQVGSCNSVLFTSYRHSSCPVLGTDGNYRMFASTTIGDTLAYSRAATNQNACGLETLLNNSSLSGTADTIATRSPFQSIEAKVLPNQIIQEKTLARDACLRRAGSVCHSDLDCSPNKFHSEQEDIFSLLHFGNQAEKDYYDQFLVCGQTDPQPSASSSNFRTYDMSQNRCCREIGSDLTTYTPDVPTSFAENSYDAASAGLKMSVAPGIAPNDPKRYSRFATVDDIGTAERPLLSAFHDRNDVTGALETSASLVNVKTPKQWKTLNEANSETCCGGGWIRKFANGQTWQDRNLISLDVTNFTCLNSRTSLITNPADFAAAYPVLGVPTNPSPLVDADYGDYCKDGTNTRGSCAQYAFRDSPLDTAPVADPYDPSVEINTLSPNFSSSNLDHYFAPRSADGDSAIFVDYAVSTGRRNITIKIPSYVPKTAFDDVYTVGAPIQGILSTGVNIGACSYAPGLFGTLSSPTTAGFCGGSCCYDFNPTTRVLKVNFGGAYTTEKAGIIITTPSAGSVAGVDRTRPGTNYYYLKRLGRLELSGVPQITYEPLYCNDNSERLVPGIFTPSVDTRTEFETPAVSFLSGGAYSTSMHALQTDQIFSANDFKCCTPLGKNVAAASKCCSGFATSSGGVSTCALPPGTDLMVYFNRFISNEGVGTDKPGGGLVESDFDQSTGEPLLSSAINTKITELGKAYCSTKRVRQGAAFGSFEPQPSGSDTNLTSRIYGIVDSTNDNGQTSNAGVTVSTGYTQFTEFGFRWNHHLYCND